MPTEVTFADLLSDGPPVRLRQLEAITGLSREKLRMEVLRGVPHIRMGATRNAVILVERDEAHRWLASLGFKLTMCAEAPRVEC